MFYLYSFNGHGDVTQLTDATGSVIKNYEYDEFGNEINPDPNDTNMFRYCGEYFDKETGTYYLRARYYDPGIGRFTAEDSVKGKDKDPLSLNLYTYCGNNSINFSDPTGHMRYIYDSQGQIIRDLDAEEFGKDSDTYKILLDLTDRYNKEKMSSRNYKQFENTANEARRLARAGTPLQFAQNTVMAQLHANLDIANDQKDVYYSFLCKFMSSLSNSSPYLELYTWFVNMTCTDWDYKYKKEWRVPYNYFNGVDMNKKMQDGSQPKNWTAWMYFDGMFMSADQFGNLNLGYIGNKLEFTGIMLINPATSGGGDSFWITYGINMAKQGR